MFGCCSPQRLGGQHNAGSPPAAADGTSPLLSPGRRRRRRLEKGRLWLPRTRKRRRKAPSRRRRRALCSSGRVALLPGHRAGAQQGQCGCPRSLLAVTDSPFPAPHPPLTPQKELPSCCWKDAAGGTRKINRWKSRNGIKGFPRRTSPHKGARRSLAALLPVDLGEGEESFLVVTPPGCWDCFQTCSPMSHP